MKLDQKVIESIKAILPDVRRKVQKEFNEWNEYVPGLEFHSDEAVIESFPYAIYEYLILSTTIQPDRIDIRSAMNAVRNGFIKESELSRIVSHALRRLASTHTDGYSFELYRRKAEKNS